MKPGTLVRLIRSPALNFYKADGVGHQLIETFTYGHNKQNHTVQIRAGDIFMYVDEKVGTHSLGGEIPILIFMDKNGALFYENTLVFDRKLGIFWEIVKQQQ